MARPRSAQTMLVKEKLIARLRDGFHQPGQRFFSNRGLAGHFGICYQTADRLIRELVAEGWLERRPAAGTFVAGPRQRLAGAALVFHERARREGSFGARLLADLEVSLKQAGVEVEVMWSKDDGGLLPSDDRFPVIWERPRSLRALVERRRFLLVLNDTPPPGLAATYADSVACDDFSGGAAAAELLRKSGPPRNLAILAGPKDDHRSRERVAGFHSVSPKSEVFWVPNWYAEAATTMARRISARGFAGVFCCNDRLAEALLGQGCGAAVVGFDDAPVAETLNLTTIAIPWAEITMAAVEIVRQRLGGYSGAAAKRIYAPRPVVRGSARAS